MDGAGAEPEPQDAGAAIEALIRFGRALPGQAALSDADVLRRLLSHVETTHVEIAALAPRATAGQRLPAARAELVAAECDLADAAERIMVSVDALFSAEADDLKAYRAAVGAHAVQILESCIFHDLVGQRLSKVLGVLEAVESRLGRLAERVDIEDAHAEETSDERRSRELLLNGPGLVRAGAEQSDIDRLFEITRNYGRIASAPAQFAARRDDKT